MVSRRSFQLFKQAADELPAYKSFLTSYHCEPSTIVSVRSFVENVPLTNKKNYLLLNKLQDLVWESDLNGLLLFCATSGSTGEPYYFPRNELLSWQYSHLLENYLNQSSYGKGRTLVIIGFGMGVWIGGVITQRAFEIASQRMGSSVAILPAGYNKVEIFKALKKLSPNFDQTILVGYPPFIKELIDEASTEKVNLKKLNIRLLFAAEAFTETFRNYICKKAGVKDPLRDTLNIYGTADIGAMASETPLSILIRRLIIEDPFLRKEIFHQVEKTPTLAQYNPEFIEFEEIEEEIVLTSGGALPLIRYAVGDRGGVIDYVDMEDMLKRYGVNLNAEIAKAGIGKFVNKNFPFVYVYERKDLTATLQGINIYPEFIKEGLLKKGMTAYFTQRFNMSTKYNIQQDQFLQINIELRKGVKPSKELEQLALKIIHSALVSKSSEFAEVAKTRASNKLLQIVLWPNGHQRYFAPGTKQKWVEKSDTVKRSA